MSLFLIIQQPGFVLVAPVPTGNLLRSATGSRCNALLTLRYLPMPLDYRTGTP
jgi:hypothetical protein